MRKKEKNIKLFSFFTFSIFLSIGLNLFSVEWLPKWHFLFKITYLCYLTRKSMSSSNPESKSLSSAITARAMDSNPRSVRDITVWKGRK